MKKDVEKEVAFPAEIGRTLHVTLTKEFTTRIGRLVILEMIQEVMRQNREAFTETAAETDNDSRGRLAFSD